MMQERYKMLGAVPGRDGPRGAMVGEGGRKTDGLGRVRINKK